MKSMKNKIQKMVLLVIFAISCWGFFQVCRAQADSYHFSKGDGSAANPYRITNCEELWGAGSHLDSHFKLMNDVDCATDTHSGGSLWDGGHGFAPIGSGDVDPFAGTFNGNGHKILNLFINRSDQDYVGLFSGSSGTISDVRLIGADITGKNYVGGLVGYLADGSVSRCFVDAKITGSNNYLGGFVGLVKGGAMISDSYATGNVTGNSANSWRVGGFVGENDGDIFTSYATGNASGKTMIGGFVGVNGSSAESIYSSFSVGTVTATGTGNKGGFIGYNDGDFYNSGRLVQSGVNAAGHSGVGGMGTSSYEETDPAVFFDKTHGVYTAGSDDDTWNFDAVWQEHSNSYPTLRDFSSDDPADDDNSSNNNNANSFKDEPSRAKILSWNAFQYNDESRCGSKLVLTIKGKHFTTDAEVRIGGRSAYFVHRNSDKKITAKFCLIKVRDNLVDHRRIIDVRNPHTKPSKANKQIDLKNISFRKKIEPTRAFMESKKLS